MIVQYLALCITVIISYAESKVVEPHKIKNNGLKDHTFWMVFPLKLPMVSFNALSFIFAYLHEFINFLTIIKAENGILVSSICPGI